MVSRYYLDYNATSPLAPSVMKGISRGDFSFANPLSLHSSGKKARKEIHEVEDYLFQTFNLSSKEFSVLFHSGATEGANLILQGLTLKAQSQSKNTLYLSSKLKHSKKLFYLSSRLDHPALRAANNWFHSHEHTVFDLPLDSNGKVNIEKLSELIEKNKLENEMVILNWTWVNNVSGIINPLTEIEKIKIKFPNIVVHVDAVQALGKIKGYQELSPKLDFYTFSGHKFGSIKGIGFSFLKKNQNLDPILWGGNQQNGLRPGTENAFGVKSIKWALEDLIQQQNITELSLNHQILYKAISKLIKDKGELLVDLNEDKNLNTIYFYLKNMPSDLSLALFDINGIEISQGSACASGTGKPCEYLLHRKLDQFARNGLRLSHSPMINPEEVDEIIKKLELVFKKID